MAGYCTRCFTALNENGLCPVCDARTIAAAAAAAAAQPVAPEVPVAATAPVYAAPEVPVAATAPVYAAPEVPVAATAPVYAAPEAPVAKVTPVYAAPPTPPAPKFCMKCGGALDENGQCPVCDAPPAPKFCMKCGGALDENGQCPVCDAPPAPPAPAFCTKCGGTLGENGQCPSCDAVASLADMAAGGTAVAVAEETATEATEQKAPKKVSALSVIATILLSLCLFITMLAATGILAVRNTVSKGGITSLTQSLDVAQLLKSTGTADGEAFGKLYDRLERDHGIQMDDDKMGELIDESTVPAYVATKVESFSGDFFSGDAELVITKDEMVDLLWENRELLENEIDKDFEDQKINKADCKQIADWLFNGDELVIVSTDKLQESSPVLYQTANIALSWVALGFFLLLSAVVGFVMCHNSLSQAAIGGGVVFILLGGLSAVTAAIVAWIPSLWATIAGNNLVLLIVGAVLKVNGLIFGGLLLVGILLLIARAIVKHVVRKKA